MDYKSEYLYELESTRSVERSYATLPGERHEPKYLTSAHYHQKYIKDADKLASYPSTNTTIFIYLHGISKSIELSVEDWNDVLYFKYGGSLYRVELVFEKGSRFITDIFIYHDKVLKGNKFKNFLYNLFPDSHSRLRDIINIQVFLFNAKEYVSNSEIRPSIISYANTTKIDILHDYDSTSNPSISKTIKINNCKIIPHKCYIDGINMYMYGGSYRLCRGSKIPISDKLDNGSKIKFSNNIPKDPLINLVGLHYSYVNDMVDCVNENEEECISIGYDIKIVKESDDTIKFNCNITGNEELLSIIDKFTINLVMCTIEK